MVGTLLTCDAAVKQLILSLDKDLKILIKDLDETHVVVVSNMVDVLRARIEEVLEKNAYSLET